MCGKLMQFLMNFNNFIRNKVQQLKPQNNSLSTKRWFQDNSKFYFIAQVEKMVLDPHE